jgi:hypothetical protein
MKLFNLTFAILLLFIGPPSGAQELPKELPQFSLVSLKLHDQYLSFVHLPKLSLTISEKCVDLKKLPESLPTAQSLKDKKFRRQCQAYESLHAARELSLTPDELKGGKDPGSVACTKHLKGKAFFAEVIDENPEIGSNETVCVFDDGSMLTANAINSYLKNK